MRKVAIFHHQEVAVIMFSQEDLAGTAGFPNVKLLVFNDDGKLFKQDTGVEYLLAPDLDSAVGVRIPTSKSNGFVVIG